MNALFDAIRRNADSLAPGLFREAYARGLAVTNADGSTRPIPVTATPIVIDDAELERRARLSALLSSAGVKMARATVGGPARDLLLSALSPLERSVAEATWNTPLPLATTRVDYFVSERPWALELNATIPAMQGYSDIAAETFLRRVGAHLGASAEVVERLVSKNHSNSAALLSALQAAFRAHRGGEPRRIALLCRRNDAQITEQRFLCERFRALGTDADVVHPDELSVADAVRANGRTYDLIYRHLFVRRLEEPALQGADTVKGLLMRSPHPAALVVNPPASQVEVKATFALLSEALENEPLAASAQLSLDELETIRTFVPWTRRFVPGPARGPSGERLADLVAEVAAAPARFVLKRSWDYGGRAVFIGQSVGEASFDERVRAAFGETMPWAELCQRCAADPRGGGFIVQEVVPLVPEKHLLCSETGATEVELFVDFSSYASVGLDHAPAWGGVCRGSLSRVVNIVGGGGVLPLLKRSVIDALLAAMA